jgi:glycosyltransferase involved in cell wall biosynthesis
MENLVSVIITCYNQEKYISIALDSVINQTYSNLECIIIDDGSIDNSKSICKEFELKDKRVKYFYFNNQGVSLSRNQGFELSKGSFIQFLDGDDFLALDKLEKQINYLQQSPDFDICYSNYSHYFQDRNIFQPAKHRIVDINPIENFLFNWDRDVGTTIHSALFRRVIWNGGQLPFQKDYLSRYEDWVFWVMLALKNIKIGHIDHLGAYYRIHDSNLTRDSLKSILYFSDAMIYISEKLSPDYRSKFLQVNTKYLLEKYTSNKIFNEIYTKPTWKIARAITIILTPFIKLFNENKYENISKNIL